MFRRHSFEHDRHSHFFEKGDLKYIILDLINEKPYHGYEIIRELEDRFHGFYSPSPGSVYPMLQLLEDLGYVSSAERDGKKVYTITDAGKEFLKECEDTINRIKTHVKDKFCKGGSEELNEALHAFRDLHHSIAKKVHRIDSEKLGQIRTIISKACRDIEDAIEKDSKS
jgi:DNA-binding PadR family transcriptional regulator